MRRAMRTRMVVLSAALGAILGGSALAQEKTAAPQAPQMTKEQRAKMATAHEKMAACLRSDRAVTDCHDEMMKSCQDVMGSAGMCPMMGMGMGHHGMMHHDKEAQPAPKK